MIGRAAVMLPRVNIKRFFKKVDEMLMGAAEVKTCPEHNKRVLLQDEMYLRNLVYYKHTGELTNLGDINEHLHDYKKALSCDEQPPSRMFTTDSRQCGTLNRLE